MNSFTFKSSWAESISELEPLVRLAVYDAVVQYACTGNEPTLSGEARLAFRFIKADIDAELQRAIEATQRRAEAGRKGGLAKSSNAKQSLANVAMLSSASNASEEKETKKEKDIPPTPPIEKEINKEKEFQENLSNKLDRQEKGASAGAIAPTTTLIERQKRFELSLVPYLDKYSPKLIRAFCDYWSEPNRSRTKMRCELERTWDTSRRLATWHKNETEYKTQRNGTNTKDKRRGVEATATCAEDYEGAF